MKARPILPTSTDARAAAAALVLVAALAPVAAAAQSYQCTLPQQVEQPRPIIPDGPVRRTPVTNYTLAVSWSPEFCRGKAARSPSNRMQCGGANGRFGFVLHGLWPESAGHAPPQWCATTPRPRLEDLRQNLCMTPVPWLLEHEWAKHGSCMTRTPAAYFKTSRILWQSLRFPDIDRLSRDPALNAGALRRAIAAANPAWRPENIGLVLSDSGWLRELRMCYSRRFMPTRCPRDNFGPPDGARVKVWRGL